MATQNHSFFFFRIFRNRKQNDPQLVTEMPWMCLDVPIPLSLEFLAYKKGQNKSIKLFPAG